MYWVRCVHSTYKSINLPMQKLMCGILPSRQMERHSARRYPSA